MRFPNRPYSGGSGTLVEISNLWDCYPTCSDGNGQITQRMQTPKFSPDGRTIYFVGRYILPSEGDSYGIYSVPTAGGEATKIPIELVNSDGTPWLNADGTPRRHISNKFALSPDGSKIAFGGGSSGESGIFTVPVGGGVPTRVTDDGCRGSSSPDFSPDGQRIVYVANIYSGADCTGTWHRTIYTTPVSNDGTHPGVPLFPEDATDEYLPSQLVKDYPSYSPDGKYIAFAHLRDKVNTGSRRLATAPATGGSITTFDYCFVCYPLWLEKPLDTTITSITSRPSGASTTTSVAFSSNDDEATFECKLDEGAFQACASPKEYQGLAEGSSHTVEVRTNNPAGMADPTPARRTWTVDITAPTIIGVSPADGARGVASSTRNIEATFSEDMDAIAVYDNFTLTKQGSSSPVAWSSKSFSNGAKTVTMHLASNLQPNTTYTATIKGGSTGAKDLAGNALVQDHSWTFTTSPPDTTAPIVSTVAPTGTGVSRGTNAIATFSERMDPTSITTSTFKLFRCSSTTSTDCATQITNVAITRSTDRLKATLNPFGRSSTLLAGRTKYKVVVTTGAKDEAGNRLDQNPSADGNQQKTWYFTTERN